jgi:DNA-directed RNA polymerase specialized sigma24 family protein
MSESSGASMPGSDAELLNTIRSGDPAPADLLRARHAAAARYLAGQLLSGPAEADAAVETAFAQVLDAIRRGGGPTDAFRPYLLTAVRRAAISASPGSDSPAGDGPASAPVPVDEQQIPDPGQLLTDPAVPGPESSPVLRAFLSLPERWRAVLWHADIEGATPAEAAPLLGLTAAGVLDLAGRARDGLARAYLQLQQVAGEQQPAALADPGAALREAVAPAVLGSAAAAYLAGLTEAGVAGGIRPPRTGRSARSGRSSRSGPPGGAARRPPAGPRRAPGAGQGGGPAEAAVAGTRSRWPRGQRRAVAAGVAAVLLMFAIGGYVLSRGSGDASTTAAASQAADSTTSASPPAAQPASPSPQPSSTSSAPRSGSPGTPGRLPPTSATPIAAPPAPPGAGASDPPRRHGPGRHGDPHLPHAQVTTQVSVFGPWGHSNVAAVAFSIADAGPAATARLSAYVSLPPGAALVTGGHWGSDRSGWNCSARSAGASCAHPAIAASDHVSGFITVQVTGSQACGQPVQVSVTGGASTASAQSAGTIQCASGHHHGWAAGQAARQVTLRQTAFRAPAPQWPGRDLRAYRGWSGHRHHGRDHGRQWPWW